MTKHLRSTYHGYVQIAEIDATDETAPYVAKTYRWDPSEPVATRPLALTLWTREGTARETLYYAHDLRKNVVSLFDANGLRRASYQYDPYGNITSMEGDMAKENPYRFSSEHHDEDLGLVYYNFRHYNPTDGRWISRDPIAEQGGWNLYGFVGNGPTWLTDLWGLEANCCIKDIEITYTSIIAGEKDTERADKLTQKAFDEQEAKNGNAGSRFWTKIDDMALTSDARNKHGHEPYPLVHRDSIRLPGNKKKGSFIQGHVYGGTLRVTFRGACAPFEMNIQSGGRASGYPGGFEDDTAPIAQKGVVSTEIDSGATIIGFLLQQSEKNKTLKIKRTAIFIHLAPLAIRGIDGFKEKRQLGSHGCISVPEISAWHQFQKIMKYHAKHSGKDKECGNVYVPFKITDNIRLGKSLKAPNTIKQAPSDPWPVIKDGTLWQPILSN